MHFCMTEVFKEKKKNSRLALTSLSSGMGHRMDLVRTVMLLQGARKIQSFFPRQFQPSMGNKVQSQHVVVTLQDECPP